MSELPKELPKDGTRFPLGKRAQELAATFDKLKTNIADWQKRDPTGKLKGEKYKISIPELEAELKDIGEKQECGLVCYGD
jgi:hypothetical protein